MLNIEGEETLLNKLEKALPKKDIYIDLYRAGFLQVKRRMKELLQKNIESKRHDLIWPAWLRFRTCDTEGNPSVERELRR